MHLGSALCLRRFTASSPQRDRRRRRRNVAACRCLLLMPQLIHSKKTMGHGKCTAAEEVQKIIDHCQQVIDSK